MEKTTAIKQHQKTKNHKQSVAKIGHVMTDRRE
jgi:hypothetical protein